LGMFSQQRMRGYKPILTPLPCIVLFYILAFVFLAFGIVLVVFSYQAQHSKTYRYDNVCPLGATCQIRFHLDHDLDEPVYLYYRMEEFYQNYRRYVNSRSNDQLQGEHPNDYDELEDCYPKISLDDEDSKDAVFLPCGLVAHSFMNDTFTVREDNAERSILKQTNDDIAWSSDKRRLFDDPGSNTDGVRIPGIFSFDYEPFIVWMRTAALPSFYKLAKIIKEDMKEGVYRIDIDNNYDVSEWHGKKYFRFSTVTWLGGRNNFIGWAFLVIAVGLAVFATILLILQCIHSRKQGDPSYLNWDKPL